MPEQINQVLEKRFGIKADSVSRLAGYGNVNYLVTTPEGRFVFKSYDDRPHLVDQLEAESEVLLRISGSGGGAYPQPLTDKDGKFVTPYYEEGNLRFARLLSFVDGEVLGNAGITPDLAGPLGTFLGRLDRELSSIRLTAIEAKRSRWDLRHYAINKDFLGYIEDPRDRNYVEHFFLQASIHVEPLVDRLRFSTIHGDANEWNIVSRDGEVAAMIDFGDMCYSPLINELAIAAAYVLMFADDHVSGAVPLIGSYHKAFPITEDEVSLLYYLIALRLCVSVCNSAYAAKEIPENTYALLSDERAWRLLKKWAATSPLLVENEFRRSVGFEPRARGTVSESLEVRRRNTSRAMSLQFEEPIKMSSAAFQHMFDAEGNAYLDCYNNVPHVGHSHPKIAAAAARAYGTLNTNTRYLTDAFNEYSSRLLARFPEKLDKLFMVNSGSAATDLALRLARQHTGNEKIAVVEYGYHGNTADGISVSHYKYAGKGGPGKRDHVIEAPIPDAYRLGANAGRECAAELASRIGSAGGGIAAFIAEPIVGCGGQVPLAEGFLERVYSIVRENGGICISDETQTGFGRLGSWFWGYEMYGVEPDIVILGKPIGNGHPMAAVVTTSQIARSFETGMEFFSSFGGTTASCAIGNAVLDVIEDERLQENAESVGSFLKKRLGELVRDFDRCGDIRGEGLFLGLEFVRSRAGKEPDGDLASRIQNWLRREGILVGTDGPHENVIKIKPPLCFTKENASELADALRRALAAEMTKEGSR